MTRTNLAILLLAPALAAQSWYVPDNQASVGNCNVIPFGSNTSVTWANQKYQTKATVADLGGQPAVITGLGFAPCGTGVYHYDAIEVVLDHHPAGTPLNTAFASNLTPAATTVLSATNFDWIVTADTWVEIGLQVPFVYNGTDDVVIEVTTTNGLFSGNTLGFHSDARQRLFWFNTIGPASTTGTPGSTAALKWSLSMLMASLSTYGHGCAGSNGMPLHSLAGSSQPGNTVQMDLQNGPLNGSAVLVMGFDNSAPIYPFDLGLLGMPGCLQYTDVVGALFVTLSSTGSATIPFPIPSGGSFIGTRIFSQFACIDPPANATGATTSNYGRIYIGN